jgi:hypothetical protein
VGCSAWGSSREAAGERWGATDGGCASGGRRGAGVVQAALAAAGREKSSGGIGVRGSGERRVRRLGAVVRHSVGHWATEGEEMC